MANDDNKSYKDMYHFKDVFLRGNRRSSNPSIDVDPLINYSIKENDEKSNVEIEGDELVLQPDLSALFIAKGKKHRQGGMDVFLKPNSFIFSDDKSLSFGEKDHNKFELKKGGTFSPAKNTPADVVRRNVNPKHYNTLIANIKDVKKDDLAKKSSAMMLEKYVDTLGNIAYLQESKKDFPDGLPPFSGAAPVFDANITDQIMENKQYAKYGGTIFAAGGIADIEAEPCPCGKDQNGNCLPCDDNTYKSLFPRARKVNDAPIDYQQLFQDPETQRTLYGKFGTIPGNINGAKMTNQQWREFLKRESASHKGRRLARTPGRDTEDYLYTQPAPNIAPPDGTPGGPNVPGPGYSIPQPGEVNVNGQAGIPVNWQFTPWQKVSQGYNLAKYASAKRYMPYRSHFNPSYIDPALVNPEQTVGDIKSATSGQISSLDTLSPILRNAQASSTFGNYLDKLPGVRSQYDNQNVGIMNQTRQYNNQIVNGARSTNMQNDQNYYQQTVVGRQNFDNLKSYLGDQYMNNVMGDVQDNQSLAYNLLTLNNPAYGYNWKNGNFTRNPKSVMDAQTNGRGDVLSDYLGKITQDWDSLDNNQRLQLLKVMTAKGFTPSSNSFKRGGRKK